MQETEVQFLGYEGCSLEKEMTTSSTILAWKIPWTEKPGGLQSLGLQEADMTEHTCTIIISEVHPITLALFYKLDGSHCILTPLQGGDYTTAWIPEAGLTGHHLRSFPHGNHNI